MKILIHKISRHHHYHFLSHCWFHLHPHPLSFLPPADRPPSGARLPSRIPHPAAPEVPRHVGGRQHPSAIFTLFHCPSHSSSILIRYHIYLNYLSLLCSTLRSARSHMSCIIRIRNQSSTFAAFSPPIHSPCTSRTCTFMILSRSLSLHTHSTSATCKHDSFLIRPVHSFLMHCQTCS